MSRDGRKRRARHRDGDRRGADALPSATGVGAGAGSGAGGVGPHAGARKRAASPEQAYLLLGSAPIEGRLSGVVDIPNSCATVYIPTAIFDFPVAPSKSGPTRIDPGMGAPHASF